MTLLGFLQSLRERIEKARARLPESLDARGEERDGSDGEQALAALHKTINPIANIYSGFCDLAGLDKLAEQIRMMEGCGAARDSASASRSDHS